MLPEWLQTHVVRFWSLLMGIDLRGWTPAAHFLPRSEVSHEHLRLASALISKARKHRKTSARMKICLSSFALSSSRYGHPDRRALSCPRCSDTHHFKAPERNLNADWQNKRGSGGGTFTLEHAPQYLPKMRFLKRIEEKSHFKCHKYTLETFCHILGMLGQSASSKVFQILEKILI